MLNCFMWAIAQWGDSGGFYINPYHMAIKENVSCSQVKYIGLALYSVWSLLLGSLRFGFVVLGYILSLGNLLSISCLSIVYLLSMMSVPPFLSGVIYT